MLKEKHKSTKKITFYYYFGKFSYQWVFDILKSKDKDFKKFLYPNNNLNQNEKKIVKVHSFDLSDGKGCFSEVLKVIFTASDGSSYHTILKIPGSSHFEDAINKSLSVDDSGNVFKTCEEMRDSIVKMHNRECDFYNKVKFVDCPLPKVFKAVQWQPEKNAYGCILMKDLGKKGKMQNISESLTLGQIMSVIEIISKLHSFSIKNMERIQTYDMSFPLTNNDLDKIIKKNVKTLSAKYGYLFGDLFQNVLPFISTEKFAKYVNEMSFVNYNLPALLNHGDIWTNNIYFKVDENDCITNEVCAMLDWQLLHLGNPTSDIARFLMISVNADIRHQYYDAIFDHYYNVLSKELGDIPVPFSLENFKECYQFSQLFQTYQLILMVSIFTNNIPDENGKSNINRKYREDILLLRLKHALEDSVKIIEKNFKNFEYDF